MEDTVTQSSIHDLLEAHLKNALCVSAWFGHGNSLCLGFGHRILEPPTLVSLPGEKPRFKHKEIASFEVKTSISYWSISSSGRVVDIDDDFDSTEEAATALIGRQVVNWTYSSVTYALEVQFYDGVTVSITRSKESEIGDVIWEIWQPEGVLYEMYASGEVRRSWPDNPLTTQTATESQ